MLVVEDDPVIAGAVCERLESWGLETRRARDYGAVMEEFAAFGPQLVLLDVSLPRYSGYHWCAEIRKVSKVPVMFISSAAERYSSVSISENTMPLSFFSTLTVTVAVAERLPTASVTW